MTRTTRRTLLHWAAACLSPGAAPAAERSIIFDAATQSAEGRVAPRT